MKEFGIDISHWQGNYDLAKAKSEGVKFVIIKAGGADGGYYIDNKFERNYKLAKQLGLNVGAYYFSNARSEADAIREASHFSKILEGKQFELPVYLDVESKIQLKLTKAELTKVVIAFCKAMQNKGYYVGVYSSESYFKNEMDDGRLAGYAHWIASWGTKQPKCGMWQFGGEVNKIRSNKVAGKIVDQNYMLIDYPKAIKQAELNGFGKKTSKTITTTKKTATNENKAVYYTIKKGDTLSEIAKKYKTTVKSLAALNNIKDVNKIVAGKKIRVK